jgi:hypothetical protein
MAKPELTLLKDPDLDAIIAVTEKITGRKCTPEEIEEAKQLMAKQKGEKK